MDWCRERCLGLSDQGLVVLGDDERLKCLPVVREAFLELQTDAAKQGFNLQACSAFRSFEAQARIVSAKFNGDRKILNINEQPLENIPSEPVARLNAILLFSAMPGFSRHHIGADLDVIAADRLPKGQSLQLTYHEYLEDSYFNEFGVYLKENIARFGFSNPYMPAFDLHELESSSHCSESANHGAESVCHGSSQSSQCSAVAAQRGTESAVDASGGDDKGKRLSEVIKEEAARVAQRMSVGGVAVGPEPWHISHVKSAKLYLERYSVEEALQYVEEAGLVFSPYVRQVMTLERINSMLHLND